MTLRDQTRFAIHDVLANRFSLASNLLAVGIGVCFLGMLVSLALGVASFVESYYTRTMSLTTLLAYYTPESGTAQPFDAARRSAISAQPGVLQVVYHDIDFAALELSSGRSVTAAVRSAVPADPEIERLELVAGANLPLVTDPMRPTVVLSLSRAMKLSDLPPNELIGREMALTFDRSLRFEDEAERESVYATISGIVQETPDESIYVHYSVLAAAHAWQRQTIDARHEPTQRGESDSGAAKPGQTVEELVAEAAGSTDGTERIGGPTAKRFAFVGIAAAYRALRPSIDDDAIIYPNLRIHCRDVDTLLKLRAQFRSQNVPTSAVLDDIAAVRELRRYGLVVLGMIGGITLLAALCSIFNTLLAAVERRTREIGILRALGASTASVLCIFLWEGGLVGLAGSLMSAGAMYLLTGALNDWMLSRLAQNPDFQRLAELQPTLFAFPGWLPGVVIGVGVLASLGAAVVPAIKACLVTPCDALRNA